MGDILSITNLLIAATSAVSVVCFFRRDWEERLIFDPERILAGKEFYRMVTSAFLHADWLHLAMNMVSLYLFGRVLEAMFGPVPLLQIYFGSIIGGSLLSLYVHRLHEYRAYGASGGVCGIIFAYVLMFPGSGIGMYFIPWYIPGWLYAVVFLLASFYALRTGRDNIGHDAHLGGAMVGLVVAALIRPDAVRQNWVVFAGLLAVSAAILCFLWRLPLTIPVTGFLARVWRHRSGGSAKPRGNRAETQEMDLILDKISAQGIQSLTEQERRLLNEVAGKYRRRAESNRPTSGLSI
jgi:membrane associated rhomboid family serine protease